MGPPLSWVWMKSVERECERWRKGTMCCVGRESGRSETLRPRGERVICQAWGKKCRTKRKQERESKGRRGPEEKRFFL